MMVQKLFYFSSCHYLHYISVLFLKHQIFKNKWSVSLYKLLNDVFHTRIHFFSAEAQIFKLLANILEILRGALHIFCKRQFIHI